MFDPARKAQSEARRTPWRLLALLIAMAGVGSLSLNILVPALPGLATKFAADPASVQLTVSLYLMGLAAAQLVFGPLSDRFGRRVSQKGHHHVRRAAEKAEEWRRSESRAQRVAEEAGA